MSKETELAKALMLLNHEHLFILSNLRDELNIDYHSEIGMFISEYKDNRRLYLAYYFKYQGTEYKFVICVNRESPEGNFFLLGLCRKDNKKIEAFDIQNCRAILNAVNTDYGFSKEGKTLFFCPLSKDDLKVFLKAVFISNPCSLSKLTTFKDECSEDYITLKSAMIVSLQLWGSLQDVLERK